MLNLLCTALWIVFYIRAPTTETCGATHRDAFKPTAVVAPTRARCCNTLGPDGGLREENARAKSDFIEPKSGLIMYHCSEVLLTFAADAVL